MKKNKLTSRAIVVLAAVAISYSTLPQVAHAEELGFSQYTGRIAHDTWMIIAAPVGAVTLFSGEVSLYNESEAATATTLFPYHWARITILITHEAIADMSNLELQTKSKANSREVKLLLPKIAIDDVEVVMAGGTPSVPMQLALESVRDQIQNQIEEDAHETLNQSDALSDTNLAHILYQIVALTTIEAETLN